MRGEVGECDGGCRFLRWLGSWRQERVVRFEEICMGCKEVLGRGGC